MTVGDKIGHLRPTHGGGTGEEFLRGRTYPGTVAYIHPQLRYYVVAFEMPRGERLREAFPFPPPKDERQPGRARFGRRPSSEK